MKRLLMLIAGALLLACGGVAHAHLMPNSVISLDFNSRSVDAEILVPMNELAYGANHPLALTQATGAGAEAPFLRDYITRHLAARTPDGRAWNVNLTDIAILSDGWNTDIRATATLTPPPGASPRQLTLAWSGVIDRVANHFVLVFARSDFATGTLSSAPEMIGGLQGRTRSPVIDRGAGAAWRGFLAALRLGMEHIAEGHDHLLFLITLILPAPLIASGAAWGGYGGWKRTLKGLALIVSAFTVGHSLTLIGAAFFGWRLAAQPVEVAIAVSILVSAIHAWRPLFGGREPWIAAGFGLVHGLAFATVIGNFRLEPLARAQAILGFNLGIEIVQLAVVIAVLPLLLLIAPTRIYPGIRTAGAAFAGLAALIWIEERLTGAPNGLGGVVDAMLGYAPWLVAGATLVALIARKVAAPQTAAAN